MSREKLVQLFIKTNFGKIWLPGKVNFVSLVYSDYSKSIYAYIKHIVIDLY
jgi:hypothetical protein